MTGLSGLNDLAIRNASITDAVVLCNVERELEAYPEPYVTVVSLPFPESLCSGLTTSMLNTLAAPGRLISAFVRPNRKADLHPLWNMDLSG